MTEDPILSVSEVSLTLKSCVEQVFSHIRVRGEVSSVKTVSSGHTYFSLKDKDSVLSAICWRGTGASTKAAIQEGLEIICTGKLSTYPGRSTYQMIVEAAEPAGIGALLKLLNERKQQFEKEGLFDPLHKKPIPFLPHFIGVITSPTGAVIRDIMHRLNDRFPRQVYLWPVSVQGEGSADQVATAIRGFNAIPPEGLLTQNGTIFRPDVLIVARGGGSLEDLWCFNEESVVRATYESEIPIISAVGHETDTTLIDYVSDLRAPTPTGAAEKAVPVRTQLISQLHTLDTRLVDSLYRLADTKELQLKSMVLPDLSEVINTYFQRLDDRTERLHTAFRSFWSQINLKFDTVSKLLKSYSYHSILERGFALISGSSGQIISHLSTARREKRLNISFADGTLPVIPINPSAPKNALSSQNSSSHTHSRSHATSSAHLLPIQGDLFHEK
ncbi:MAG: exodeoxyribonuclease VII large subunit [Pseudomonadota bacterium]|nr:exodeoxyribonuclease VII large subunit [Pseudomonadota bacterium]